MLKNLGIKFIASLALLFLILGVGFDVAFGNVFATTVAVVLVSYFIGDRLILPRTNNTVATASDFVLSFAVVYFMLWMLPTVGNLFTASLVSAVGVIAFEFFFHQMIDGTEEEDGIGIPDYRTQTQEFAEETNPLDGNSMDEDDLR
ncbi:DUF2512 family protein [Halalkalibacillus sediminis]|nr:DUF2512 family protein [Halalkalibacillus sediminis]